jgi:uncharacterized protein YecT (DUF1311 family)
MTEATGNKNLRVIYSIIILLLGFFIVITFLQLKSSQEKQANVTPKADLSESTDKISRKLSPLLSDFDFSQVVPNDFWEIVDEKDNSVGFLKVCDEKYSVEECATLVPQTYSSTEFSNSFSTKDWSVFKTYYNVSKSADPVEIDTIIFKSVGLVLSKDAWDEKYLVVVDDIGSLAYINLIIKLKELEEVNECSGYQTQLQMNSCISNNLSIANESMQIILSKLEDEQVDPLLLHSQASWERYRDDFCALESKQFKEGSLERFVNDNCKYNLTLYRIQELQNFYLGFYSTTNI